MTPLTHNNRTLHTAAQQLIADRYCRPPAATAAAAAGDMLFFHSYKSPGLRCDIVEDIRLINDTAMKAAPAKTGVIILGGGELGNGGVHRPCARVSRRLL